MYKFAIKINELYYAGESDEVYSSGFSGVGWQDYKNNQLTMLKLVPEIRNAKVIEGFTNLKSCLDKVFQRARDKAIKFEKLEVVDVSLIDEWPKQECGYCGEAKEPDVICDNCWEKMQLQNI